MNRLVTYSANQGLTWSPVKLVFDLPYASATEQRIMRLDERRFLSYTRADPLVRTEGWDYERNMVHFSLSEDEGETWSEPWKGNFLGAGAPELHRLNDGSFIIIYRDMDPNRAGVSGQPAYLPSSANTTTFSIATPLISNQLMSYVCEDEPIIGAV